MKDAMDAAPVSPAPSGSPAGPGGDASAPRGRGSNGSPARPPLPGDGERPGGLLSRVAAAIVMYHDSRSVHAEQYRTCRTNLTALNRGGAPWAIVVTSSRKGEGKSITAANVGACLAELPGSRVCLVDTDFRTPAQAALFGLPQQPGITELLRDEASLAAVVRPTVIGGLDLIPGGGEPRSPAELVGSERFGNILAELKRRYTWIVIDSPPTQPYTDACVLTARCNGALLVVRMEETDRDLVQSAAQAIKRAGGKVLGTFLTGMTPDPEDEERLGHYYYRADSGDREMARQELARLKSRREAERRLRNQEKAYIRKQQDSEREKGPDSEPEV